MITWNFIHVSSILERSSVALVHSQIPRIKSLLNALIREDVEDIFFAAVIMLSIKKVNIEE